MNDLFYFLKEVRINAYADDEQIYASDKDPVKLEMKLQCQLFKADQWFGMNGMITNPDKYQAMILGIQIKLHVQFSKYRRHTDPNGRNDKMK